MTRLPCIALAGLLLLTMASTLPAASAATCGVKAGPVTLCEYTGETCYATGPSLERPLPWQWCGPGPEASAL
jgi:hypothetical protein